MPLISLYLSESEPSERSIRYSWPLYNTLSGHWSLYLMKGQVEDEPSSTTQMPGAPGGMQGLSVPLNSMSPNLPAYPKTPRCDCSVPQLLQKPHQWVPSLQKIASCFGDPPGSPGSGALLLSSVPRHVWGIWDWHQCWDAFITCFLFLFLVNRKGGILRLLPNPKELTFESTPSLLRSTWWPCWGAYLTLPWCLERVGDAVHPDADSNGASPPVTWVGWLSGWGSRTLNFVMTL